MRRVAIQLTVLAVAGALLAATAGAARAPGTPGKTLTILVKSDVQHGKKGPDGKWHDAFLPADFSLKAGAKTQVTILNYDGGAHSLVSPSLNLNVVIPGAKGSTPGRVTFSLVAPKSGRYDWWCGTPCDPWAMSHDGYMRGYVTVTR